MRSPLCDLVGVEFPIIQAGMSIFTSPELAAAVSNAGALGSLGAWNRPVDQLLRELAELQDLTDRPSRSTTWCQLSTRCLRRHARGGHRPSSLRVRRRR